MHWFTVSRHVTFPILFLSKSVLFLCSIVLINIKLRFTFSHCALNQIFQLKYVSFTHNFNTKLFAISEMQKTPQKVKNLMAKQANCKISNIQIEDKTYKAKNPSEQNNKLLDCISAKQLLSALTTLKAISQKETQQQSFNNFNKSTKNGYSFSNLDVSFEQNQYHQKAPSFNSEDQIIQNICNQSSDTFNNGIDFSQYMNIRKADSRSPFKNQNQNKKATPLKVVNQKSKKQHEKQNQSPAISYKHQRNNTQVCFTPNKEKPVNLDQSLTVRNSHTHIQQHSRSALAQKANQTNSNTIIEKNQKKKHPQQTKQDQTRKVKLSYQSKKILSKKQQEGKGYVPIQFRTDEYIKSKREKMAKILEEEEVKRQIQGKQCTFKPKTKVWKKPAHAFKKEDKNFDATQKQIQYTDKNGDKANVANMQQTGRIKKFQTSVHPTKSQVSNNLTAFQDSGIISQPKQAFESTKITTNYKNKKFNFLLDLIK